MKMGDAYKQAELLDKGKYKVFRRFFLQRGDFCVKPTDMIDSGEINSKIKMEDLYIRQASRSDEKTNLSAEKGGL